MERKTQALTSDSETAVLMEIQKSVPKKEKEIPQSIQNQKQFCTLLFSQE